MKLCIYHLIIILLIMTAIMVMMMLLSKKTIFDWQKSTPFECGFNPMSSKRLPFSTHFFLIAIIFLIFDIEIIIIMPMTLTLKSTVISMWMLTSSLFIMILILGLYHEWQNGMLSWTK
uniref:NADH-ubiquinone oxidoreductase chain 3 n=2 Tax=Warodia TaxID=2509960 RepID=A0A9E6XQB2_9HEMI|nr:NADH dehydrogenase subunit 3 [Warodia hoso]YP_010582993.1 NADH dehydrogenase subunit 3 [Warodia lineata]UGN61426.1 NADH dehydrogenase subunit 3 [Warodia hoso]UGN61439.1 NADH dehydrogenase subunit 3 [Warodia lineata]WRY72454.1 NADH dehydrogenase subunit 3 [Warodia biguttata]